MSALVAGGLDVAADANANVDVPSRPLRSVGNDDADCAATPAASSYPHSSCSPAHAVGCNKKLSIREFLRGRTLVLTGATGFLAKVFLEKMLWEQPEVHKVFLIITPRGGKSAAERLREQVIGRGLHSALFGST